jgi:hypothetical protein
MRARLIGFWCGIDCFQPDDEDARHSFLKEMEQSALFVMKAVSSARQAPQPVDRPPYWLIVADSGAAQLRHSARELIFLKCGAMVRALRGQRAAATPRFLLHPPLAEVGPGLAVAF